MVPLARERRKWASTCRDQAAAPWRVSGHGVGGAAALLVALRLAERYKARSQKESSTCGSNSSSDHQSRRSSSAVSMSVPVAGCVTFGATKCLAGNAAKRAAKRLQGVLLHVTQVNKKGDMNENREKIIRFKL